MKTKNIIYAITLLVIISQVLTSCKNTLDITSRKYNKGFYVHMPKIKNNKQEVEQASAIKKTEPLLTTIKDEMVLPLKTEDTDRLVASLADIKTPFKSIKKMNQTLSSTTTMNKSNNKVMGYFNKNKRIKKQICKPEMKDAMQNSRPGLIGLVFVSIGFFLFFKGLYSATGHGLESFQTLFFGMILSVIGLMFLILACLRWLFS